MTAPSVWAGHYLDGQRAARRPARVTPAPGGLEIAVEGDGRRWWPYAEIRQTSGFYAGEQLRFERGGELPETLLVDDVGFLAALRAVAPGPTRAFHDPRTRRLRGPLTLAAAVATVALAAGLYVWGIPALAAVAAARVPLAWEIALGEAALEHLAPAARRCEDPGRQRRLDEIVARLTGALPEPRYAYRLTVVDHPLVNAFAAPGGFLVVFSGLLERAESPEVLAGVLAHEIQHVERRHATQAIVRQASTGILLAALVGDVSGVMAFGLEGARLLGDLRHGREAEHEADREGMRLLAAAGVDPEGMLTFFRGLEEEENEAGRHGLPAYLSTHPAPADRLQALAVLAAGAPRPGARLLPGVDWRDVTRICAGRRAAKESGQ